MDNMHYRNYGDYTFRLLTDTKNILVEHKKRVVISAFIGEWIYKNGKKYVSVKDLQAPKVERVQGLFLDCTRITITFEKDEENFVFELSVQGDSVSVIFHAPKGYSAEIKGNFALESNDFKNIFPVQVGITPNALRSAIGNPTTYKENAVYNRLTDKATVINYFKSVNITFSGKDETYCFSAKMYPEKVISFNVKENLLAEKYDINFAPLHRKTSLPLPPVGWMTWYAVKFDASEDKVLKNARWQAENLLDYGANTVWVDWEWYHDTLTGERYDNVSSLKCDPVRYPNGMKYVADEIKKMGLIPALWIGYTNEPDSNDFIKKHPEAVLVHRKEWCGRYFYDLSHPEYLNNYLPSALKQVHDWGYRAVKYDTLPLTIMINEFHHDDMYDNTLTTKEVFRNMIKKTREELGEDMYMLSCSGGNPASILWASDYFDAARIGEDIFSWEDYIKGCLEKLEIFYPLHNIQFLNDPDNVVLRSEFNSFEQSKSRITLVSLLGLPMTFGDEFEVLEDERVDLIKRNLPMLDIRPMDLEKPVLEKDNFLINLSIDKPFAKYLVSGAFNMTDSKNKKTYDLKRDFGLNKGNYLVYDFYRDEFLGVVNQKIKLDFNEYECRVLSFRPVSNRPQIVNTNRHITGGAAEILNLEYKNNHIEFASSLVKNDEYVVSVYIPDGFSLKNQKGFEKVDRIGNIMKFSVLPQETKAYNFEIYFEK